MRMIPKQETLTVEFKSNKKKLTTERLPAFIGIMSMKSEWLH